MNSKSLESLDSQLKIATENNIKLKPDDIFIDHHNTYYKVLKIVKEGLILSQRHEYTDGTCKWDEYKFDLKFPLSGITTWDHWNEYYKKTHIKLPDNVDIAIYEKNILDNIQQTIIDERKRQEEGTTLENTSEKALAILDKNLILKLEQDTKEQQDKFEVMQRVMDKTRRELQTFVSFYSEKIEKIRKVIGTIELYLGINEDIIQIQQGQPTAIDTPITLRQQMLYMDEEVGVYQKGGLDINDIKDFDDWLLKDKNYKRMIPEDKDVVVFRVRRYDKDYECCAVENYIKNIPNHYTYILIRNGDNIYRIFANIIIQDRLFPQHDELQKLFDADDKSNFDKQETENKVFTYKQNMILIQGLIDRSQVFQPIKKMFNIFDTESYTEKDLKLIYDDEVALPSGRKTYVEWKKELNSRLVRGSRIFFSGFNYRDLSTGREQGDYGPGYDTERFNMRTDEKPPAGVYSIERIEESDRHSETENLVCYWNPHDIVWTADSSHERTHRLSFNLYRSDYNVLNYDQMILEDIEYYINDRYSRRDYLDILPVLVGLRERRKGELKWELGFVKTVAHKWSVGDKVVWEAIEWWKNRVIMKRPLTKDDKKAWRMINNRIKYDPIVIASKKDKS